MAPASSGVASHLTTASLSNLKPQVRFHYLLRSYFLVKATVDHSMNGFFSDGQRLYLRICDGEGRVESCRMTRARAGWALRSENWVSTIRHFALAMLVTWAVGTM
ncbi:hypothetical protein V6N12_041077 [Hibiscus sabdariffa]|uniref:Uncharacterized protein n=1 Tax=Hibiscus sabdariffa TaxID=183260 RepID=A0ABR2E5I6_9ROSI